MSITPLLIQSLQASEHHSDQNNGYQTLTSSSAPHTSVKIIDTDNMPWPPPYNDRGWKSKILFSDPETGGQGMLSVSIIFTDVCGALLLVKV
jgi:hypothetical protein